MTNAAAIATAANSAAQAHSRKPTSIPEEFYGVPAFPVLSADSNRKQLIEWLLICDPHGCYADADSALEYGAALTLAEAWQCVSALCE